MEEAFDPYRKWLGIPPEEQPPNHYRLLGIALFEEDADVISNAADRQMSHVRTYQTGKRAPLSQALLNELSAARLCLLDPAQKKAYDGELSARHARLPRAVASPAAIPVASEPPRRGAPAPLPVGAPFVKVASAVANQPMSGPRLNGQSNLPTASAPIAVTTRVSRGRPVRRSSPSAAITVVAAVGLLVLLVLFVAFFLGGDGEGASGNRSSQRPTKKTKADSTSDSSYKSPPTVDEGVGVPIANSAGRDDLTTQDLNPKPPVPTPGGKKGDGDDNPNDKKSDDNADVTPRSDDSDPKPPPDAPSNKESTPPEDESPSRPAVVKKPPPPSPAAIDKAYRIVRKEFEPQLREAIEPEERFDLARQIVERAGTASEPATKYALYLLARNLSVQLASPDQACDVVDLLSSHFDVDVFEMKRQSLDDVAQFVTLELEDYTHLLRLMQQVARDALAAENNEGAVALTRLSKATSLKVRTPKALKELPRLEDLLSDVDRLAADVAEYDREVRGFDRSLRLLKKDANDAGANLSVGRYWLLVKADWPKALPHLSKGADPAWKDPATIDLAQPKSAAEQVALADTWHALGLRKGGLSAPRLFERARTWYGRAVESAPEADKPAIAAKIADIEKQLEALRPPRDPNANDAVPSADGQPSDVPSVDGAKPDAPASDAAVPDDDGPAFPD